jgi:hypothetical protein
MGKKMRLLWRSWVKSIRLRGMSNLVLTKDSPGRLEDSCNRNQVPTTQEAARSLGSKVRTDSHILASKKPGGIQTHRQV